MFSSECFVRGPINDVIQMDGGVKYLYDTLHKAKSKSGLFARRRVGLNLVGFAWRHSWMASWVKFGHTITRNFTFVNMKALNMWSVQFCLFMCLFFLFIRVCVFFFLFVFFFIPVFWGVHLQDSHTDSVLAGNFLFRKQDSKMSNKGCKGMEVYGNI